MAAAGFTEKRRHFWRRFLDMTSIVVAQRVGHGGITLS
jgi:hypothetical protein